MTLILGFVRLTRLWTFHRQTVVFAARVDAQIVKDHVHLFDVHEMNEPHLPHRILRPGPFQVLVPLGRQRARHVRSKVWRENHRVSMKPDLNTTFM